MHNLTELIAFHSSLRINLAYTIRMICRLRPHAMAYPAPPLPQAAAAPLVPPSPAAAPMLPHV